jgi:hypothetical protein
MIWAGGFNNIVTEQIGVEASCNTTNVITVVFSMLVWRTFFNYGVWDKLTGH